MYAPPPSYESIHVDRRISLSNSPSPSSSSSSRRPPPTPSVLPLTIPTKKYLLSSGFPYHSTIFDFGISPDTWRQFSDEIVQATKLSITQQSLAWTSGIGVGLVSVAAVPPFGAAAGVFAHKAVYDKTILNNVRQGLEQGKLGEVLKRWNESCWRGKGVFVKLVVKQTKKRRSQDSSSSSKDGQEKNDKKKAQQQRAGRFELVLESIDTITASPDTNRASVIVRSSSDAEDTRTNAVPVEIDNTTTTEELPSAYELPIMSNSDEKVNGAVPPNLPSGPSQPPQPTPELANEKAAQADAARLSWTSVHPSEAPQSPRVSLLDQSHAREALDGIESPVSDMSRGSFTPQNQMSRDVGVRRVAEVEQLMQNIEVSPVAEAERRYFEHLDTPIDASLAPAPLFAR